MAWGLFGFIQNDANCNLFSNRALGLLVFVHFVRTCVFEAKGVEKNLGSNIEARRFPTDFGFNGKIIVMCNCVQNAFGFANG